jgi:hypothetical protein
MTVPSDATQVTFPELPDTLAAFRPMACSRIDAETTKFDTPAAYDNYLDAAATCNGFFYEVEALSR